MLENEALVAAEGVGNNGGVAGVGERKIGVDGESVVAGSEGGWQRPYVGDGVEGRRGCGGEREECGCGGQKEEEERESRRRRHGGGSWKHLIS